MSDLMIDLETLGNTPEAVIISIGACFFDLEQGKIISTFDACFDVDEQIVKGRRVQGDTLKFWMNQSDAAKKVFSEKAVGTQQVLEAFTKWIFAHNSISKIKPWGNGSTFDISMMENIYRQYGLKIPWLYYNVFDLRTFKRFVGNRAKVEKKGVNHNALDDAIAQAEYVIQCYKGSSQNGNERPIENQN